MPNPEQEQPDEQEQPIDMYLVARMGAASVVGLNVIAEVENWIGLKLTAQITWETSGAVAFGVALSGLYAYIHNRRSDNG